MMRIRYSSSAAVCIGVLLCGWMCVVCLAETCGGLQCGQAACCVDQKNGPQCYNPSQHTCLQSTQGYKLCGTGTGACGTYPEQFCYDRNLYDCVGGGLVQKGSGGGGSTASPTTHTPTPTPSTTRAPTPTTPTPSTTRAPSGGSSNVCGNANCGNDQCCLLMSGQGACYSPDQYTCSGGMLCPAGHQSCGGSACYKPSQYSCVDGKLQQTSSSSTSSPSTTTSAPPSTSSPSTTTSPPTPSSSGSASTGSSSTGGGSGSQAVKLWGVNYSAKLSSGACPSVADVEADMRILATITTRIRIYSIVECNQAELILRAIKSTGVELTLTLGIWLDQYHAAEYPNEMNALTSVINNVGLDLVDAIIVGSETQYRHNFDGSVLIQYLQNTTSFLSSRGYGNIAVVTADVIYTLIGNNIVNYESAVYANQFPFWEGARLQDSVSLLSRTIDSLRNWVGSKTIVIGETGWPTDGSAFGSALPSEQNLAVYLHDMVCELHRKNVGYFWFEAFDEPYKNTENANQAEKHWGLYTADRKKKAGITLPVMCAV